MLALSAREAIRDAIAAFGSGGVVALDSPATPERIFWAVQQVSGGTGGSACLSSIDATALASLP